VGRVALWGCVMQKWTNESWAREQLSRCVRAISEAPAGTRNNELFKQAATMADYIDAGVISERDVAAQLEASAIGAGLDGSEIRKTLRSAMGRGDGARAWYPSVSGEVRPDIRWAGRVLRVLAGGNAAGDVPTVEMESQEIRVTWYSQVTATQGEAQYWTWADLELAVNDPADIDTDRIPLWAVHEIEHDSRAQVPDGLDSDKRQKWRAPNVLGVHALVLDYDDDEAFNKENVRRWWGSVQYIAHTTRHHMVEKGPKAAIARGRVVVALSRSVSPEELVRLADWVTMGRRGSPAATELRTPARAYFVPIRTASYWGEAHLCGRALDVDVVLEQADQADEDAAPDPAVLAMLELGEDGRPLRIAPNLDTMLEHDPRFAGRFSLCEFSGKIKVDGRTLTDTMETAIALEVGRIYGVHFPEERIHRCVAYCAEKHSFHPVRDYLEHLEWDGVQRIDRWLVDLAGCEDSDGLSGPMGTRFLISAVARIFEPGCKVDTVLILAGEQGLKKSTAFAVLASEAWFSDTSLDMSNKDAYQQLAGAWIYEHGELDSIKRSEATAVKAFLSSRVDKFRPSYGRNIVEKPRQCVFVGTTNDDTFLADSTGSRRFWPRKVVRRIDLAAIARARDALWAEAVHLYRAGEQWWLTDEEEAVRNDSAKQFEQGDPWEEAITRWARTRTGPWSVRTILVEALGFEDRSITHGHAIKVGKILAQLRWTKRRATFGARDWVWSP
jgi:hypothetical protein